MTQYTEIDSKVGNLPRWLRKFFAWSEQPLCKHEEQMKTKNVLHNQRSQKPTFESFAVYKKIIPWITILSILGTTFIYSQKDTKMKLINVKSGFVVVEYQGNKTIFHDRMLEKEMTVRGVIIPPPLRSEYGGKSSVRLDEIEFQKAFKDVYCKQAFNSQAYQWEH